jgi:hypothetical protein
MSACSDLPASVGMGPHSDVPFGGTVKFPGNDEFCQVESAVILTYAPQTLRRVAVG